MPCPVATSATNRFAVLTPSDNLIVSGPDEVCGSSKRRRRRPRFRGAVIHARSPRSPFSAFEIPVTLQVHTPATTLSPIIIDTRAMLDSGASCCFVHPRFVKEHNLPTIQKKRSVRLRTIDNSDIKSGLITHEVPLRVVIDNHSETLVFSVTDIGDDNLILGINWLRHHNPLVDWSHSTISFNSTFCKESCIPTETRAPPVYKPSGGPRCPPRKSVLERDRRAARKAANALKRGELVTPVEDVQRVQLLDMGKGKPRRQNTHSFARKTNTSHARLRKPSAPLAHLKRAKTSHTKFVRQQKIEAIRIAHTAIDAALTHVESVEQSGMQREHGVAFEQCWDGESVREAAGPNIRAAAGTTFSQALAEEASQKQAAPPRSVEEMVPPEFHEFLSVFDKQQSERLPEHTSHDLAIDLEGSTLPPPGKLYQLAPAELRSLKEFIDENLAKGYIRPSKAPCGAPVFFVKKKDGTLRLVVDFRALNAITRPDSYPIPLTNELLDRLKAAKVFTTLDMRWGYYNVRIREGDEWKTSFRTRYGQFEFLVMQFGLRNAPAAFQRMVNELFHDLVDVNVVLYLDDIIIFSSDPAKHDDEVTEVLTRLRKADLFLKPEKCQFRTTSVDYLGLKITPGHVGMDPVKVSGVTDWPTPQNVRNINQFLGFCNFYRRFVENYAKISAPLERLKRKDVLWRWGAEEQRAFDALKHAFVEAPVLVMPDMEAPFRVETDASDFAMGAILSQEGPDGDWRPVAYYSKALQPAERNYQVYDKELLAVVRALETWRPYLEGNPHRIQIFSDHRNLEFFMTTRDLNRRQARWSMFLNRFNFIIYHRPGHLSAGPDGLSRRPDHEVPVGERDNIDLRLLPQEKLGAMAEEEPRTTTVKRGVIVGIDRCGKSEVVAKVGQEIRGDAEILQRIREVSQDDPKLNLMWELESASALVKSRLKDFTVDGGLVRYRGLVYVPDNAEVKRWLLQLYHDSIPAGHPGISNTLALLARNYYWPRMSEFVKRYVEGCETCQKSKPRRQPPLGKLQPLEVPTGPWQHITTDYIGPLPSSRGHDAIQVVCDKQTKRAHFLPAHTTDGANDMCDVFMERVWCLHGTPKKIIADRGPQFAANFARRMWERLGIKRALSTAHHAQTDGQTERVNQELEVYLRAYVDFYQDDWMDWLPFAEFAYNNRFHSAIGMSPFYAEYGYNPTFSIDPVNSQSVPKADERLDRIHQVQKDLASILELAAERMKRFYDAWVDESPDYIPGDRVYLERADLRSTRPNHKLDFCRFGPFKISQKISDTSYRLMLPDGWAIHNVFHVSCLIPAREDTILGRKQEPPAPVEMETGVEMEIERILKERKTRGGVTEFLVHWKGFGDDEDEWLKEYDLTHALEAIEEFRQNERMRGKKRRRRKEVVAVE